MLGIVDGQIWWNASAACADALTRPGDSTVTEPEAAAYLALICELKRCGVTSPFSEILDKSTSLANFRTA